MVFGSTYCPISHLEIKDGDACILFPLGFKMDFKFDRGNTADINCFAYLHTFIAQPVEVIFGGNVSAVTYLKGDKYHKKGDTYDEHELFMLVHLAFHKEIMDNTRVFGVDFLEDIPLFNTVYHIWEEAKEMAKDVRNDKTIKLIQKEITMDQLNEKTPTPDWIKNIYKVAWFMGKMGIPPHPVFCHDQHQTIKEYEKMRKNAIKNNKLCQKN